MCLRSMPLISLADLLLHPTPPINSAEHSWELSREPSAFPQTSVANWLATSRARKRPQLFAQWEGKALRMSPALLSPLTSPRAPTPLIPSSNAVLPEISRLAPSPQPV